MIGSMGTSVAALKALGTKMDVTAKNVANINSEGYKKSRATLNDAANGGVTVDVERIDTPGPAVTPTDGDEGTKREQSNVNLTEEMADMITTRHGYNANLKAVETRNDMLGAALDIVG